MELGGHKVLDFVSHLWPYISGVVVTLLAGIRLWWYEKQVTKKRIRTLEALATNMVSKQDLQACRDDVRAVDEKNLDKLSGDIRENMKQNAKEHQDIMKQIIRLHK